MRALLASHWTALILWCLLASCIAFALMGVDKARARRGAWRIPESTLWLFALLGGGVGSFLGMGWFHHKTRHWYFRVGLPLVALIQVGALIWIKFPA